MIISRKVIGCALAVHRSLGPGYLEAVYQNALTLELDHQDIGYSTQPRIEVRYRQHIVGVFRPDLVIQDSLLLELKAIRTLTEVDKAQLLNYLKVTDLRAGLLLNFGSPSLQVQRMVNRLPSDSSI